MLNSSLVVVDLDASAASRIGEEIARPVLVVGHSTNAAIKNLDGVDVALTTCEEVDRSWVRVDDVEKALDTVRSNFERNPVATVVATQVLRMTEGIDAERALMIESLAYGMLQNGTEHAQWLAAARRESHIASVDESHVSVDRVDNEITITFNRPHRRNAYGARTRNELVAGLELALLDESIAYVHLRGEGPSFCSGGDLSEFGTVTDGASGHLIRTASNAAHLLSRMGHRTTAHVHGPCFGAGVELSAACAIVIADPGTTFTLPEVAMGLLPGAGGSWSVPRRIGRRRATWLAITGESIDVQRGLDWGLVDKVLEFDS